MVTSKECDYGGSTFNISVTFEAFTTITCHLISPKFNFVSWSIC